MCAFNVLIELCGRFRMMSFGHKWLMGVNVGVAFFKKGRKVLKIKAREP